MKLLRKNSALFGLLILLLGSCEDNSTIIKGFKNALLKDMIIESKRSVDELDKRTERLVITENMRDSIPSNYYCSILSYKSKKDSSLNSINSMDTYSGKFIDYNIKKLLYNFGTYKQGSGKRGHNWDFDSTTFEISNCNPEDTVYIKKVLKIRLESLKSLAINKQLSKLSLINANQLINKEGLHKLIPQCCFCFNKISRLLHYKNKVYFQNEEVTIIPGLFTFDKTEPRTVHLLKENTTDFIMEKGEKKKFTNSIEMNASEIKGIHTVKGEVIIKHKGMLIPKPFEFRYIVE